MPANCRNRDNWSGEGYSKPCGGMRGKYYAICAELGINRSQEQDREFLSVLLKKSLESRSELSSEDWTIAANHMKDALDAGKSPIQGARK